VFEIYGIDPKDRNYNCHHIIERRDYKTKEDKKKWDAYAPSGRFDLDEIGNLAPVTLEQHAWINAKINGDGMPSGTRRRNPESQKKKTKKRKKKRSSRSRRYRGRRRR